MGIGEGDDRDGREKDRGTGAGEREIGRETGWEREKDLMFTRYAST